MRKISGDDSRSHQQAAAGIAGSAALLLAVVIVGLGFAESNGGLPFSMPRSWYTNQSLWYLLALAAFVLACFLLKRGSAEDEAGTGRSAESDVRFHRAVLYTRSGCPLCDDMRQLVGRYARFFPPVEVQDISSDPQLAERFSTCVPVLEIDGRIRFRGRVNEILLRRLIDATPPRRVES